METPNTADSAGQTWSGRTLHGTGFDDDFGAADAALRASLEDRSDERRWMAALADARLIVPIVAALGEASESHGMTVEKSTDMAVVTLTAPDGQRALPVFTGLDTLQRWDPEARPSPVTSALAAQAAISERCDVMVLDVGSPHSVVLRSSMVWALAQAQTWLPAHEDPAVRAAIDKAAEPETDIVETRCEPGEAAGVLRVALYLRGGLDGAEVQALATRVGERVATDGEVRARIDALSFAVRPAGDDDGGVDGS